MKTTLTVISIILIQSFSFAQNFELISDVKMKVSKIDSSFNLLTKTVEVDDSLGSKDVYKNDTEICLIVVHVEDWQSDLYKDVRWYFSEGNLIYTEQIWTNINSGEITDYHKLYLKERKLIAWEKGDGDYVDESKEEFRQMEKDIIAYTDSLLKK